VGLTFREATVRDAEELARGVVEGVAEYPAFAPAGWAAPTLEREVEHALDVLTEDDVWCLVAEDGDGRIVGQVTVLPADKAGRPTTEAGLAHLSNLFVAREHWGSGLARELHVRALDHARDHGFATLRLFVAAEQHRARRFFEREGWTATSGEFHDPGPGLVLVEYRRRSAARSTASQHSLDAHAPEE